MQPIKESSGNSDKLKMKKLHWFWHPIDVYELKINMHDCQTAITINKHTIVAFETHGNFLQR